jgi:hypothetical protein
MGVVGMLCVWGVFYGNGGYFISIVGNVWVW